MNPPRIAATRGRRLLPIAEAGATICENLNCDCAAKTTGAMASGRKPVKAFPSSATRILDNPLALESSSAT